MMNVFLWILGGICMLAGAVLLILLNTAARRAASRGVNYGESQKKAKSVKWPAAVLLLGLALTILSSSFQIVPTGYTGVRTTFGLIDQESCMPGFNPLVPFVQEISLVNNKQQDLRFEDRIWSETKEQTVVFMEGVQVSYRIVPESSAWIYANVDNWIEKLVDPDLVGSSMKSASRSLTADVVTDRGTIEPIAQQYLQDAMDGKYGPERVEIKKVTINNMDFEDSYNAAIAEKSNAIQEQQKQAIQNQTNIEKAAAEAEAERERARGKADAELIQAEAKAEAARKIAGAITNATQRQDAIEKWDGKLPQYVAGEDASFGIMAAASGSVANTDKEAGN